MSWNIGIQLQNVVSLPQSWVSAIIVRLCTRLAWEIMTPLGALTEPEVYWRKATADPSVSGRTHASGSAGSAISVAMHATWPESASFSHAETDGRVSPSVSTSDAPQSSTIPAVRAT